MASDTGRPGWVDDLLRSPQTTYRPPSGPGLADGSPDVAGYIRQAASQRGIAPDVAIRVAESEGGLVPNRTGSFATGKSFWPFQLHYGGKGTPYEAFGDVAGMGNTFTAQTGYQPGDPDAWQAATDYALDQAKRQGWGAWYGARKQGITGFQGISRDGAAGPATGAAAGVGRPAWVSDLLSSRGARAPAVEQGTLPNAPTGSAGAPEGAPAWVQDLLRAGDRGAGGPGGYEGPAQTDELWPVSGQRWGAVNNPFGGTQSRSAGTTVALPSANVGADLTARYGDAVVAPVSGTIVSAYDAQAEHDPNENSGWGGSTLLRGDNGYYYRLSHAAPGTIRSRPGQRVRQGEYLQAVGVSGNSTGPHLDAEKFDTPGHFVDIAGGNGVARGPAGVQRDTSPTMPAWVRDLRAQGR